MNRRILALLAGLTLAAISSPALAADSVSQVITPGLQSASVANLVLSPVSYSHTNQTSTGSMTLTADDSTGSGAGWNVTIITSAFVYSGVAGGSDIPAVNFSLTSAAVPAMTAGQLVDPTSGPKVPATSPMGTLDTARKTVQALAAFGDGTYTQALGVSLSIPGQAHVGTYTGALTTTIAAAP